MLTASTSSRPTSSSARCPGSPRACSPVRVQPPHRQPRDGVSLARDASITEDTTFQEVEVNAKTKRVLGQSSVDRANAGDAGGLASLKARKVESALEALGLTVGAKILTGDSNLTATLAPRRSPP